VNPAFDLVANDCGERCSIDRHGRHTIKLRGNGGKSKCVEHRDVATSQ
jgi:hypothetical protein